MFKNIFFILAVLLASTSVANAGGEKVLLCHSTESETNETVLISVSENAVESQLAQGSTLAMELPDGTYACVVTDPDPDQDPL